MNFPPTDWTALIHATINGDTAARQAWEDFYTAYRKPVMDIIVAGKWSKDDGVESPEDMCQSFMVHLMDHSTLSRADPERGRFRTYLRAVLFKFLCNHYRSQQKGGKVTKVPLEEGGVGPLIPPEEQDFDRIWAMNIFEQARRRTGDSWAAAGKAGRFAVLSLFLPGAAEIISNEEAARRLGISLSATVTEISRLRKLYRQLLREAVARTVAHPADIEEEMLYLRRILAEVIFPEIP